MTIKITLDVSNKDSAEFIKKLLEEELRKVGVDNLSVFVNSNNPRGIIRG